MKPLELVDKVQTGQIDPGFYGGLNNKIYHLISGLSSTLVKMGLISLKHLHVYLNRKQDETVASIGTLAHSMVLEPETVNKVYQLKLNGNTKEGKAQKKEAEEQGLVLVRPSDWTQAEDISRATLMDDHVASLLAACDKEVSGFAKVPEYPDIVVKIRPDAINRKTKRIYDLKTISDNMNDFQVGALANRSGWYHQAAFYQWVAKLITGDDYEIWHIYADSVSPRLVKVPDGVLEALLKKDILPFIPRYAEALSTNVWPGFDNTQPREAMVPTWTTSDVSDYEGVNDVR